jgi:hypothetical protein
MEPVESVPCRLQPEQPVILPLQTAVDLFDAEKKLAGVADAVRCLLPESEFVTDMPAWPDPKHRGLSAAD